MKLKISKKPIYVIKNDLMKTLTLINSDEYGEIKANKNIRKLFEFISESNKILDLISKILVILRSGSFYFNTDVEIYHFKKYIFNLNRDNIDNILSHKLILDVRKYNYFILIDFSGTLEHKQYLKELKTKHLYDGFNTTNKKYKIFSATNFNQ
jgi:hypothetical protein